MRTSVVEKLAGRSSPIEVSQHYADECSDVDLDNKEYPKVELRSV